MQLATVRRKAATAALVGFRRLPRPLRRALVRAGTPAYTVGAVCLVEHDGQVLLLWQPHRPGWSLPGGLLGRGESPGDAVTREVAEEVGLRIDPGDPVAVGVQPELGAVDVIYRVQLAQRPQVTIHHEARKAQWWPLDELPEHDRETALILEQVAAADRPTRRGRLA